MSDFVHPIYSPAERRMRRTFLTLMNALGTPGRTHALPDLGDPFALIAESLLDLETSAYTAHGTLKAILTATGTRLLTPESAAYHFYELGDSAALEGISIASVGTHNRPDDAATLFIGGCTFGTGTRWTLTGPGINGKTAIRVDGIPDRLWQLRVLRVHYPLGWDVYLLDGHNVIGLPRSTMMVRG